RIEDPSENEGARRVRILRGVPQTRRDFVEHDPRPLDERAVDERTLNTRTTLGGCDFVEHEPGDAASEGHKTLHGAALETFEPRGTAEEDLVNAPLIFLCGPILRSAPEGPTDGALRGREGGKFAVP